MATEQLVVLKGGVSVPKDAFLFALELEDRGFSFIADGDDLIVRPRARITDADRIRIKANKHQLVDIARYCDDGVI